ncbi:MAG: acyl carrier protein [Bacteroidota bacterium]|nr:acyl carrier protein [Bacteroidota bacterium]
MEEKIKQIMADVFLVDLSEINEQTSPDNLVKWDSLAHLNLVVSLEEEFDIMLNEDQIIEMLNFKLVVEVVKESLQNNHV